MLNNNIYLHHCATFIVIHIYTLLTINITAHKKPLQKVDIFLNTEADVCSQVACLTMALRRHTPHRPSPSPTVRQWHHMLHIIMNNGSSQRIDSNETEDQTVEFGPSHQNKENVDGSSALFKSCHQRESKRLHCGRRKSKENQITSMLIILYIKL